MDLSVLDGFALRLYDMVDMDAEQEGNFVVSPLSLWLLIAGLAHKTDFVTEEDESKVEYVLGVSLNDIPEIFETVRNSEVVETANVLYVSKALAEHEVHVKEWFDNDNLSDLKKVGVPSKEDLDTWVKEMTKGLIDSFPMDENVLKATDILASNVLYAKLNWTKEFNSVKNENKNQWASDELLSCYRGDGAAVDFYEVEEGTIASLRKKADVPNSEAISVTTVGDTVLSNTALLGYAHAIANSMLIPLDINDLTEADNLKISEIESFGGDRVVVEQPAWEAEADLDLGELLEQLGVRAIEKAFRLKMPYVSTLKQSAVSKYNRYGFEGAAVSRYSLIATGAPSRGMIKEVELTFDRPFAVLIVDNKAPVFAGMIREAVEVEEIKE